MAYAMNPKRLLHWPSRVLAMTIKNIQHQELSL